LALVRSLICSFALVLRASISCLICLQNSRVSRRRWGRPTPKHLSALQSCPWATSAGSGTCWASSRVGATTQARNPVLPGAWRSASTGTAKASVFPDPSPAPPLEFRAGPWTVLVQTPHPWLACGCNAKDIAVCEEGRDSLGLPDSGVLARA
jgi:hypothetical protein